MSSNPVPSKGRVVFIFTDPVFNNGEDYASATVTKVVTIAYENGPYHLVNVQVLYDSHEGLSWVTGVRLFGTREEAEEWFGNGQKAAYWPSRV